jgi:immunity protein, SdpI family
VDARCRGRDDRDLKAGRGIFARQGGISQVGQAERKGALMAEEKRSFLVTRFHILLFGVLLALTATGYAKIPAAPGLPMHWGLDGHPDEVWPRDPALMVMPIVALVLLALIFAIGRLAPVKKIEPGRYVTEAAATGVLLVLCALQFSLLLIGVGSEIDLTRIVAFVVAIALVILGAALPRSAPNAYAGVRLPWTMTDKANWTATHRLTGVLMVIAGFGLALVALLWPDPVNLLAAIGPAVFAPVLIGGVFSFVRSRM